MHGDLLITCSRLRLFMPSIIEETEEDIARQEEDDENEEFARAAASVAVEDDNEGARARSGTGGAVRQSQKWLLLAHHSRVSNPASPFSQCRPCATFHPQLGAPCFVSVPDGHLRSNRG